MEAIIQHITIEQGLLIIFNLIIIESLLSVDNAAVLATMVMDLPKEQRGKALKYGILGAYVFRGICLVLAAWLVNIWWLKPIGGFYLVFLALKYFFRKQHDEGKVEIENSRLYKYFIDKFGLFWSTVIMVEIMDIVFSIDNVLAAAAYVEKIEKPTQTYLLWIGVFIGILAMRFVAQGFIKLMEKFPFLEKCAYLVIFILGTKLLLSAITHFIPESAFAHALDSHHAETVLSLITTGVFLIPIITSLLFNFPRRDTGKGSEFEDEMKNYDEMKK